MLMYVISSTVGLGITLRNLGLGLVKKIKMQLDTIRSIFFFRDQSWSSRLLLPLLAVPPSLSLSLSPGVISLLVRGVS